MAAFERDLLRERVARLAEAGVYIGTSSWKYAGWCGMIYDESRYAYRGKFAKSRFEKGCLSEYANVFKTVCVDAAYYTFPSVKYLQGMASDVPPDFRFGFKVTDTVTIKNYPQHERFGAKGGKPNEFFLNAEMFIRGFLEPCETIRPQVGVLMFEFSKFHKSDFEHGRDFVARLDGFLGSLPRGWPYAIEMRNRNWLTPEYFACLARHQVTHVFNSWTDMPPVGEQMALAGSETNPNLTAARFLLKPGRSYRQAVESFEPYRETKEVNEAARKAGAALVQNAKKNPKKKTFIFVNNRLEGNALQTIKAMLDEAELAIGE